MRDLSLFFDHLDEFEHKSIFDGIESVWEPLTRLEDTVQDILEALPGNVKRVHEMAGLHVIPHRELTRFPQPGFLVEKWIEIQEPTYIESAGIFLGAGTVLEATAIIKGPAVIGRQCEIRQGAYLRGNVLTGDHCVLGHNTEVKNSILMNHTEAGHFNYLGDSIVGSYVNMGAGSKLANLRFRSREEKIGGFIMPITLEIEGQEIETGMEKFGSIVGDHAELGCNAVLCPGVLLGKSAWVYPNMTVSHGYYPPHTILASREKKGKTKKK